MMTVAKRILLISCAASLLPLQSMAQLSCQDIFKPEVTYYNETVEKAILKDYFEKAPRKLSANDLTRLVHKMFEKYEGKEYEISHYKQLNAAERTNAIILRQVSEQVTRNGLEAFFKEKGLLVNSSSLLTKLWMINRAQSFNLFSAVWATMGVAQGKAPIFLPEVFFKMKPQDMNTLLLKGLESKEGLEITNRYGFKQEVIRGYSLFNRYYTRVAMVVTFVLIYNQLEEYGDGEQDSDANGILSLFLAELHQYEAYKEKIQ